MFAKRILLATSMLMALLLVAAACGGDDVTDATGSQSNPDLPAQFFSAPTVGGGQIDLGDLKGQDVVLWFWAPW